MTDARTHLPKLPEGIEFLKLAESVAEKCCLHTDEHLPKMGKAYTECMRNVGTMLSTIYRLGSCHDGCRGGDHLVEYILGRTCTSGLSALSLLRQGYYDESLALARNMGETANLLALFVKVPSLLEEWKNGDEKARLRTFSPVRVRLAMEQAGASPPIEEDRYRKLSSVATHVTPSIRPQGHNVVGVPTLGAIFQEIGAMVCLNEITWAVGWCGISGARLLNLPSDKYEAIKAFTIELLSSVGGVTILKSDEMRKELRQKMANEIEERNG